MTIKDAFALAFDKADATNKTGGKIVHLSYKFKVSQYKRGEQGDDDQDETAKKDAADKIAADSMPTLRALLSDALSSHGSIAMDKAPVETPFSDCKAKNPWSCKYHGQAVMTAMLNTLLTEHGITPVKPATIEKLAEDGKGRVTYQLDMDVNEADVAKAKDAIAEFGKMDGIDMNDASIKDIDGNVNAFYEIVDELDPDDEFEDEDDDFEEDTVAPKKEEVFEDFPKKETPKTEEPPKKEETHAPAPEVSPTPKTDEESKPTEEAKPAGEPKRKKVDAVGMLLEASKAITGAAKSVNRGIDRGSFSPRDSRLVAAEKMRGPLEAMAKATGLPAEFRDRAAALVASLDAIKASKEGGFKDRVGDVPYFDEAHFRAIGEAAGMKLSAPMEKPPRKEEPPKAEAPKPEPAKKEEPKDEFVAPKSVAEGVMKMDELKKSSDYIESLLSKPDEMSASLADELKDELKKDKDLLSRYTKATDELRAKDEAEEKTRKEAAKKAEEEAKKDEGGDEESAPADDKTTTKKHRAKKGVVETDTKLSLGKSSLVLDGYTGKDINKAREEAGLAPLVALKHIDTKVKNRTENFRVESKKLAAEYGDPEIDISDPEVFEQVNKNWAETIKRIVNEGQFGSFMEPDKIMKFLTSGKYMVSWGGHRVPNLAYSYGIAKKDWDEAAISAILLPGKDDRAFKTKCSDRFGAAFVEWDKESDLVPCFSACDADEPAKQARAKSSDEQAYNPTLVSNPTIASLPAFTNGLDSIVKLTGHKSATGKPMPTWVNAIKLLRKGPLDVKDAKDFNNVVNGEDEWKEGFDLFGWNEAPLLGSGTTKKVRAIHISSDKWNKLRSGPASWSHGTLDYATAADFVHTLKTSYGEHLRKNGIKIVLDGKEVEL